MRWRWWWQWWRWWPGCQGRCCSRSHLCSLTPRSWCSWDVPSCHCCCPALTKPEEPACHRARDIETQREKESVRHLTFKERKYSTMQNLRVRPRRCDHDFSFFVPMVKKRSIAFLCLVVYIKMTQLQVKQDFGKPKLHGHTANPVDNYFSNKYFEKWQQVWKVGGQPSNFTWA